MSEPMAREDDPVTKESFLRKHHPYPHTDERVSKICAAEMAVDLDDLLEGERERCWNVCRRVEKSFRDQTHRCMNAEASGAECCANEIRSLK